MTTSEPPSPGGDPPDDHELMLLLEVFPVSRYRSRVDSWRRPTRGGSGRPLSPSSVNSVPDGSSSRTCPVCSGAALAMFSETFGGLDTGPASERSQLVRWVHHTHVGACSSWPTPKASDGARGGMDEVKLVRLMDRGRSGRDLNDAIGGPANPTWVEWLMGFPQGWTDVEP